ncbi:hypothetical protein AB0C29_13515 [Actinoplanes sp. NPDC048791]|uniref:hypothetical protein n=1 Tax=Actinoplanes sp. NPDC048791 TaxID=3154623 RepID=UPI00340E909A
MTDHYPPVSGAQYQPQSPAGYAYPAASQAPGYPAPPGYAAYRYGPQFPYPPPTRQAPGWLLIVLVTSVAGIIGLALTISRAAEARRMGLSTFRYWLAWAIPFGFWLPLVIYINFVAPGGTTCSC